MELEEFKAIPAGEIFRVVTDKIQSYQKVSGKYPAITYVCKKGHGYDDWAIYYHLEENPVEWISKHGDKVMSRSIIQNIFPCSDDIYSLYRF